ncbi:MAG: hypothetical protein JJU02_09160 [Cryomorphaceae bacterium]|nr:hypothetical protein [Cryomorphaceae bacterium]
MKKFILSGFALSFFCISCSKDAIETDVNKVKQSQQPQMSVSGVPSWLDTIGVDHNNSLYFVADQPGFPFSSEEEFWQVCAQFDGFFANSESAPTYNSEIAEYNDIIRNAVSDFDELTNVVLSNIELTNGEEQYLMMLEDLFKEALLSIENESVMLTPSYFESQVNDIVNNIVSNEDVPFDGGGYYLSNSFESIIACLYIAKYSYSFWYDAANNSSHPWNDYLGDIGIGVDVDVESGIIRDFFVGVAKAAVDVYRFVVNPCWSAGFFYLRMDLECAYNRASGASASIN